MASPSTQGDKESDPTTIVGPLHQGTFETVNAATLQDVEPRVGLTAEPAAAPPPLGKQQGSEVETVPQAAGAFGDTANAEDSTTKRKGSKNAGSKKGSKRVERPQSFWYRLCQLFEQGDYKSQIEFLRSPDSGEDVGAAQRMHFSRAFKKYVNGTLGNCEESRCRKRKYEPLEERVIQYWTEQQELIEQQEKQNLEAVARDQEEVFYDGSPFQSTEEFPFAAAGMPNPRTSQMSPTAKKRRTKKGKSPLAWSILQAKAREWAKEMGLDDGFQASAGWIDNVLKRHAREVKAKESRSSLDSMLAQRRNWANYASRKKSLEKELLKADQMALLRAKGLNVGDRVTVMDISQQAGDLVVSQITPSAPEDKAAAAVDAASDKRKDAATHDEVGGQQQSHAYLTVERKRHGSTQSFPITDVRKVVLYLLQEEDTVLSRQLLQPGLDDFRAAMTHFPKSTQVGSRVLRPVWEEKHSDHESIVKDTTTVRISLSDTSCAEKINIQALRSHILPMFRRDHKSRMKVLEELQSMSQRSQIQQKALEKLTYAQMTHDMAIDYSNIVDDMPSKERFIVYQVDYRALDTSMRGRLFALNPAPLQQDFASKSYAPRPLALQGMPQDLRNALVGQFAHLVTTDKDITTDILCSLADMAQASNLIPAWRDYRGHTTAWWDFIQQVHEGISLKQAQLLPRVLLQGGTYDTWKQGIDEQTEMRLPSSSDEAWTSLQTFVMRLTTEWRALRDVVLTLPQYAWAELDRGALINSHVHAPAAIPNVCMVRILQACEREVWTLVSHVLQSQGWIVRAKLIEGLLVESHSTSAEALAAAMALAETGIKSRGWDVALVEGPCFGKFSGANHKAPLPLLQEARQVMEELQQAIALEQPEDDNNPSLTDSTAAALAKPEARNVTWNDSDPTKPNAAENATNNHLGEAEATKADLQLFAQL